MTTNTSSRPNDGETSGGASPGDECGSVDPRVVRSRRLVLAAATELLVESGPRAVTVDAVSERSGVAKSTMYRHWDSRTALLVDVMSSNVPEVAVPDASLGFAEALHSLVRDVAATLGTPEWARLLPALLSLQQHMPELRQLSEADHERKMGALKRVLDLGGAEGVLPGDIDASLVATVVIGPVMFAVLTGRLDEIDAVADYAVDRFLASYRA